MKSSYKTLRFATALSALVSVQAQVTIPATNGSLPIATANGCAQGYSPGRNVALYTLPYSLDQVLTIIGNFTNLTWAGSPDNSVTTNASSQILTTNAWAPGDARFYALDGAYLIETILTYQKPAGGPYVEDHTLAPLTIALPGGNVSTYAPFDGQTWSPTCNGKATAVNFTANFCATNVTAAAGIFQQAHIGSAVTVGQFLGGQNFSSCAALGGMAGNATMPANGSASSSPSVPVYTGGAASVQSWVGSGIALVVLAAML
jgi:hypothetical protein